MANELLPCPFCGSPAESYPDGDHEGYSIMCTSESRLQNADGNACPLSTFGYKSQADADTAWNRRAALAAGKDASPIAGSIGGGGRYRLLSTNDTIQKGDEFIDDDATTWVPVEGWPIGGGYSHAYKAARRPLPAHGIGALPAVVAEAPAGIPVEWTQSDEKRLDDAIACRRSKVNRYCSTGMCVRTDAKHEPGCLNAAEWYGALSGPDSQQPHVSAPSDVGSDKLGGC